MSISLSIFVLAIAEVYTERHGIQLTAIGQIVVALNSAATFVILLRLGRRQHPLARTISQIYVLCGLALSWIGFVSFLIVGNIAACSRRSLYRKPLGTCALFTTVNILGWALSITLFGAAYAVYRRAIALHGDAMVPAPGPPPRVAAWRLSQISDTVADTKNQNM
ncbi:hypothetical protein C8R44DRAFT_875446 [Mycena epipterygia]|nr:hypothetical protein C8R44DRAFT_875446 [Mycena epipterygia]